MTSPSQIQRAVDEVDSLDVLINNAGVAIYDDLSSLEVIEKHLAVNFLGPLKVTHAFLPLLKRSKGAIVNNLSWRGWLRCQSYLPTPFRRQPRST